MVGITRVEPGEKENKVQIIQSENNNIPVVQETKDKRLAIALEFFLTEKSYVANLQILTKYYMLLLKNNAHEYDVSPSQFDTMFSMIPSIEGLNKTLLDSLDLLIENWSSEDSCIGDLFHEFNPYLKMYSEYANQYSPNIDFLHSLLKNTDRFQLDIDTIRLTSKCPLSLEDLLVTPIQRIPRYQLYLLDLLKSTEENHPDFLKIQTEIKEIKKVTNFINESVRKNENNRKLEDLRENGLRLENFIEAHRFLIKDGQVKCIQRKGKQQIYLLLFNDLLVHVKKDVAKTEPDLNKPQYVWPLSLVWMRNDEVGDNIVNIIGPTEELLKFYDNDGWQIVIEDTIKTYLSTISYQKDVNYTDTYRNEEYIFPDGSIYNGEWKEGKKKWLWHFNCI